MNDSTRSRCKVALDRHFQAAVLAGPVVWLALSLWVLPAGRNVSLQTLVMVILVYPILEELAFRGFLQSWLTENPWFARTPVPGISAANIVVSVIFAGVHLLNQPPAWAAAIFFPSLVFGYFLDRYRRVWPSIVLHCWYNAGFVLFFY